MNLIENSMDFSFPFRRKTPIPPSDKIIFLSMEGNVTEEVYFKIIQKRYPAVAPKIRFVSVQSELDRRDGIRTRSKPHQLLEKMEQFIRENEEEYEFSKHPEDEFWLVMDVDDHWEEGYRNTWKETIRACQEKGYQYAISNPFFEMWLLLHHREVTEEDRTYAVTEETPYQKTDYFRNQLRVCHAPLRENHKKPDSRHYSAENVEKATERAVQLHVDPNDLEPHYYATTVYLLTKKIIDLNAMFSL